MVKTTRSKSRHRRHVAIEGNVDGHCRSYDAMSLDSIDIDSDEWRKRWFEHGHSYRSI